MKMKKMAAAVLAAVIAASVPITGVGSNGLSVTARAAETEGTWSYRELDDGTISLTNYSGSETDIVIPSTYDEKTVSQLNDRFFGDENNKHTITSLTIPAGVEIGGDGKTHNGDIAWRFGELYALESINIVGDDPAYSTVDGVLFNKDKTILEYYPNAKKDSTYTVPDTVTGFEYLYAFYLCPTYYYDEDGILTSNDEIVMQSSYPYLKSIILSDNTYCANPFIYCSALTEIKVSEDNPNYTVVDGVLFNKDMTELLAYPRAKEGTSYTIPDSVTNVKTANAFSGCANLKTITVSKNVYYMGLMGTSETQYLFNNCVSLEEIIVDEENETYSSIDGVVFNKDKTILRRYPRAKNSDTYEIPDGVTRIDGQAFKDCSALTEITIPKSVTSILDNAFQACNSLTSVIYEGTEEEWGTLQKGNMNDCLTNATITFAASAQPTPSQPTPNYPTPNKPDTSEPETSDTPTTEPTVFEPVIDDTSLDEAAKEVLANITVTDENGAFEDGTVMNVSFVESEDGLFCFDITFTKDGKEVQPGDKVTVKVPVPEALKNGDIYVYHIDDDGSAELMPSKVENGFAVFETDKFSVYVLSDAPLDEDSSDTGSDETPATSTDNSSAPSSDNTTGTSNPSTGIGFAFVPAILAAGAVVISKKRK